MSNLQLVLEIYLASMLAVSGLAKIDNLDAFHQTLRRHGLLRERLIPFVAVTLPVVQVGIALLLLSGYLPMMASLATLALFLTFFAVEIILVVQKKATDCGCFGVAFAMPVDKASILTSLVLVTLGTIHLMVAQESGITAERGVVIVVFLVALLIVIFRMLQRRGFILNLFKDTLSMSDSISREQHEAG